MDGEWSTGPMTFSAPMPTEESNQITTKKAVNPFAVGSAITKKSKKKVLSRAAKKRKEKAVEKAIAKSEKTEAKVKKYTKHQTFKEKWKKAE